MYQTARDLFDAAREAALDAERIRRQLRAMDEEVPGLGSAGFEARVRSTPDPDRMAARVSARADQEERLKARREQDYALIDAACEILYGPDNEGGLWALVGWPADAIYHHYLALRTWGETAALMGYNVSYVYERVAAAFDLADANGDMWTRLGRGLAEG